MGSEFSQLRGQASFAVVYIVSPLPEHNYWTCGKEFQKLFSSCMLLNKLGLFDRVTQASGSHKLMALYTYQWPTLRWRQSHEARR